MNEMPTLRRPAVPHTTHNCARLFLQSMNAGQRKRFKTMLEHGHVAVGSVSRMYDVPSAEFMRVIQEMVQE